MIKKIVHKNKILEDDFNKKDHWEHIYSDKQSNEVSWYQSCPVYSLDLIRATKFNTTAHIIDIGGGASTLVDCLLDANYQNISVLDIAHSAIEQAKLRLGRRANKVNWIQSDITQFSPTLTFDIWHDRAVFHFLCDEDDRSNYVRVLTHALKPDAQVIIATFSLDGPEKCSGLDIIRYSPETLSAAIGNTFQLVETNKEEHLTPSGTSQNFIYCRFIRV
ncbi:MAG: SAM-dependent methyltransferase [Thiotrichaceae bacterium]|nr:MAG: SAM-dependent methyltransferase [Thiotrichaceae bacterium]